MCATGLAETRIDLVGSFLRPGRLLWAIVAHAKGELSDDALREIEDAAVRDLIAEQDAHGLPLLTDGEYRRGHYMESVAGVAGLEGFLGGIRESVAATTDLLERGDDTVERGGPHLFLMPRRPITRPVTLARNAPLDEWSAAQPLTNTPVKAGLLGAQYFIQSFEPAGSTAVYPDVDAFTADLVAALHLMVSQLVEAGCRYVHIDGPGYTSYSDENNLAAIRERGEDPEVELTRAIAADNAVIAGFPDVTFGIHLCRGNRFRFWHREGTYDAFAERLFNELNHVRFMLEYDSERAGDFTPLRFLPEGKIAVLGLITTKYGEVEKVDDLKRRIDAAATHVPLERLAISPQCGFASMLEGNLLSVDEQWRKIDVMLETAQQVWG